MSEPLSGGTSILRKLHQVMRVCDYIQKDKENSFHRYRYASEAAIKEKLHAALVEHGVIPQFSIVGITEREITRIKDGKPQTSEWLTTANIHYKFSCVETGEFVEGSFFGCGVDPSDKGLYKAVTGAIKYILTSQFLIATGDDPEEDDGRTQTKAEKVDRAKKVAEDKLQSMKDQGTYRSADPPPHAPFPAKPYMAHKGSDKPKTYYGSFSEPNGEAAAMDLENADRTEDIYPATSPETIRELDKVLDQPPAIRTIEMRHASKVAETDAVLKDVEKDAAKKKGRSGAHGIISLDKLEIWKKLKLEIRAYTGSDDLYRATIQTKAGVDHANEIQTPEQATEIWNILKAELKRLGLEANRKKQDDELMGTLNHAAEVIGQRAFGDVLFEHSCANITQVLDLESDPLQALLAKLKECVDARKGAT